jgi:hypothetical protein
MKFVTARSPAMVSANRLSDTGQENKDNVPTWKREEVDVTLLAVHKVRLTPELDGWLCNKGHPTTSAHRLGS